MEGRVEDIIEDILSQLAEGNEEEDEVDYSSYYDDLYERAQSPFNLNTATREQLESLFFLSDIQVENLLYYLYMYGDMQTVYELRLVEGMDEESIRRLLPFVVVEPGERKPDKLYAREVWRYGRHELYARFGGNVERADGYRVAEGEERAYEGSPLHHQLKYRFHYKDRIWAGLTMEKDAGEPFLINKKGYDFYSAYAQVSGMGVLHNLVLGDYRAAFGEGLVVRTGFSLGKSAEVLNTNRPPSGLRRSGSADEYNFFRGAGATVRLGDFDLILCNPPYIPRRVVEEELDLSVRGYEPHMALDGGEDGLDFYRAITLHWKWALRSGGKLAFEIGYDQSQAVEQLMRERGFVQVRSFRDPGGHWRVVEGILEPIQPEEPAGKEE